MDHSPISVADVKDHLSTTGINPRSIELICSARAKGTYDQYDVYLRQFSSFCLDESIPPRDPTLDDIVNFLQVLIDRKLAYTTVNTARSALSFYFTYFKGVEVGKIPLVCALLDGYAREHPPTPKYVLTWDVNILLNKFRLMEGNSKLDLNILSFKTVTLLSITTAARGQAIHDFCISRATWQEDRVAFLLSKPMKNFVKGAPLETVTIYKFQADRKICPYRALKEYLYRTKKIRGQLDCVWISLSKPYRAIGVQTLHNWIKNMLQSAKIVNYGAHTTRHAATSMAALLHLSVETIILRGRWSNCQTFAKFYKKSIESDRVFQDAILNNSVDKSKTKK